MKDLGTLGGNGSMASAINEGGAIVGWSSVSTGENHACLWDATGIHDLNGAVSQATGWLLGSASDINASGQVVGLGQYNGRVTGFLLTPVQVIAPQHWGAILFIVAGIINDAGGIYIGVDGKPHPVDPWGPYTAAVASPARDLLLGVLASEMAGLVENKQAQELLTKASQLLIQ
jgi:probable HAF family extracellular repeat protein